MTNVKKLEFTFLVTLIRSLACWLAGSFTACPNGFWSFCIFCVCAIFRSLWSMNESPEYNKFSNVIKASFYVTVGYFVIRASVSLSKHSHRPHTHGFIAYNFVLLPQVNLKKKSNKLINGIKHHNKLTTQNMIPRSHIHT